MNFETSQALVALLLVPLLILLLEYARASRRRALMRFGQGPLVERLAPFNIRRRRRRKNFLMLSSIALMVIALARPQFGSHVDSPDRGGQDIVIALDVSNSMLAEDIEPNRLSHAKQAITQLAAGLAGDRIGLVSFAGRAFVQCPLTSDYATAQVFINSMTTDSVPIQGTNIGHALQVSLETYDPNNTEYRTLILITDGEDHEGEISTAVDRAIRMNVRVHTIGIGNPEAVPIPLSDHMGQQNGFRQDSNGRNITTQRQDHTLESIARRTGGQYWRSGAAVDSIEALLHDIRLRNGREVEAEKDTAKLTERFQLFVGLALVLLIIELVLPETRRAPIPSRGSGS